jgi:hypothetical protein
VIVNEIAVAEVITTEARRSHPTIFIPAFSVPILWVRHHKVYSGRCEADVVMSSTTSGAR